MSTATDAALIALGKRFEKLLLEHMDAWLIWAPRMRAARAEVEDNTASLAVAIQRTSCDVVQARMSEIERDMQPLAEEIIAAPATSLGGLRAKALVALWEAYPTHASHEGTFEFRDDGSRSLFESMLFAPILYSLRTDSLIRANDAINGMALEQLRAGIL